MEGGLFALTFIVALGAGLVAGIFFAFSNFVMGALGRVAPEAGISAMQSINVVVLNPVFLGLFMGTAALSLILAVAAFVRWSEPGAFLDKLDQVADREHGCGELLKALERELESTKAGA